MRLSVDGGVEFTVSLRIATADANDYYDFERSANLVSTIMQNYQALQLVMFRGLYTP